MGHIISRMTNGVAEILALPSKLKHEMRERKADFNRKVVTDARGYENAPNYDERGNITDAFKVRSLRKGIKKAN